MYVYGKVWNQTLRKMRDPISETVARQRFETGPWFSVARLRTDILGIPIWSIELEPHGEVAKVLFYNTVGSIEKSHTFQRTSERLFMEKSIKYHYPDDSCFARMNEADIVTVINYQPDGITYVTTDDITRPDIERTSYEGVNITPNWEPMPKFGDWESLARRDRSQP